MGQVPPGGEGWVRSSQVGGGGVGQVQPGGRGGQVQPGGRGGSGPAGGGGRGGSGPADYYYYYYLLHGGRYASCVHAGGLSCLKKKHKYFFIPGRKRYIFPNLWGQRDCDLSNCW